MSAFSAHVLKEHREQRALLFSCLGVLVLAAAAVVTLAPTRTVPSDVETWFVILALGAGLVMLGSDLVCGEIRRGQLGFLRRSPGGLRSAFAAKMVMLFGGLGLLLVAGWASGALCSLLCGGADHPDRVSTMGDVPIAVGQITAGVFVAAPWMVAVSCWIPRSASAFPATAAVLVLVVGPPVIATVAYELFVEPVTIVLSACFLFVSGQVVAWFSFVRGLRFGPGRRAAGPGILAAALAVLPIWGWTADRVWSWHHVDVADPDVTIMGALLGDDGETLFVSLVRSHGPTYAVVAHLSDGSWQQCGAPSAWFVMPGTWPPSDAIVGARWLPQPVIERRQHAHALPERRSLLTGAGAVPIATWSSDRVPPAAAAEALARASRAVALFRMPDGSRAWFEDRTVVIEAADGERSVVPWPEHCRPGRAAGFGFNWFDTERDCATGAYFDLARRQTLMAPDYGWWGVRVRVGDWVICSPGTGHDLFDPLAGELHPLSQVERVEHILSDGRLIVWGDSTLELRDPYLETRELLRLRDGSVARVSQAGSPCGYEWGVPVTTPNGGDLLLIRRSEPPGVTIARVDGATLVPCVWREDRVQIVAIPDDDHLLVIRDRRSLERWSFGSDEVEVLFRVGSVAAPSGR